MALFQSHTGERFASLSTSVISVCCLVTLILCSTDLTADAPEELSVTAVDGEYSLQVAVVLNAPVEYVYKVITDYKNAYRINPVITNVVILPSGRDQVVRVRNLSEQCVGPFCFNIAWAGDITETRDGGLEVETLPGLSNFVSGSARWRIRPQGERTSVLYESKLKPAFFIPPVIGDSILKYHIKNDNLATFKRIECQTMIMLAVKMAHQPDDFEQLPKEGKECINPLG